MCRVTGAGCGRNKRNIKMAKKKYLVKHNFMYQGQFTEVGSTIEAEPKEVRYLVLGGQLEDYVEPIAKVEVKTETKKNNAKASASVKD